MFVFDIAIMVDWALKNSFLPNIMLNLHKQKPRTESMQKAHGKARSMQSPWWDSETEKAGTETRAAMKNC